MVTFFQFVLRGMRGETLNLGEPRGNLESIRASTSSRLFGRNRLRSFKRGVLCAKENEEKTKLVGGYCCHEGANTSALDWGKKISRLPPPETALRSRVVREGPQNMRD